MSEASQLSEAKRALLEKYLRGEIQQKHLVQEALPIEKDITPAAESPSDSPLVSVVPIRSTGSKQPFFYSHVHVEGGAFYCIPLAEHLGPEQPFYILEPHRFESGQIPLTLEAMATEYVKSMRAIQPHGPYLLGGFCGGAIIVFEMARQLQEQGERVDLLLLIEAVGGPGPASVSMVLRGLAGKFLRSVSRPIHLSWERQITWYLRIRHYFLLLRYASYRKKQKKWLRPSLNMLNRDWIGIFSWLISAYKPVKFQGTVTYLWAEQKSFGQRDWKRNHPEAAKREEHIIPGDSWSCVTDYLQDLANCINECLKAAQS